MNLNLTEVFQEEGKKLETEVPIGLDVLSYTFGSFPVREKTSLKLTIFQDRKKALNIHGEADLAVEIPCDRCLDLVKVPMKLRFDEKMNPKGAGQESESEGAEDDASEDAFEWDYLIQGYNLDVDKLISGEALLNWPSRVLCKEDCRGLCPVCGHNLNLGDCGCDRRQLDPRMAEVLDVFRSVDKEV